MKLRVWLMLGVTISFLILIPSILSCVATVPPEDEPKTSSFLDPNHHVQTPDPQEVTWWADTNIHPGDKPLHKLSKDEEAYAGGLKYLLELEKDMASSGRESELQVASTLDRLSTDAALGAGVASALACILSNPGGRETEEVARPASTTTPRGRETEEVARPASTTAPSGRGTEEVAPASTTSTPGGRESEEVASASTTTPRGRDMVLAVDSTGHSSTPLSSLRPSSIPQSSDLASASTPHSRESELFANHLNEATPVNDYHAIHIDTEQVDSFCNPILIRHSGQDNPAPRFQDPSDNIPHHVIQVDPPGQQPPITSTISGDDQLGIAIRFRSVAAVYRNERLSRAVLGYVVPVTLGILTMNTRPTSTVVNLVLISMVVGFTSIWYGLLFRIAFPRFANRIEQLGVAHVLASFFGLLSTFLPSSLAWLPWLCWALAIAPFTLTFSTNHQSRAASGPVMNDY